MHLLLFSLTCLFHNYKYTGTKYRLIFLKEKKKNQRQWLSQQEDLKGNVYLVITPSSWVFFTGPQFLQLSIQNVHKLLHQPYWWTNIASEDWSFGVFSQFIGQTSCIFSTSDLKWQFILSQQGPLFCLRLLIPIPRIPLLWWNNHLHIHWNLQLIETNNILFISED